MNMNMNMNINMSMKDAMSSYMNNMLYTQLTFLAFSVYIVVYLVTAFSMGKIRAKCFSLEFMAQFNEEHNKEFGCDAPVGGLPDDGNGYYGRKLSYADWYVFNNW